MQKKAAFIVYPMFCNWEIALVLATLEMHGKEVVVFSKDKNPVTCEEGLIIVPHKTFNEFEPDEFDCIFLSGIGGDPTTVVDDLEYSDFLKQFAARDDVVIAAISLAPVLLAKAGILAGKKFCVGMFEEAREKIDFFEYENQVRAPIVIYENVITAMGMAFREFAVAMAEKLGLKCSEGLWGEVKYPINPEDYIFWANKNP